MRKINYPLIKDFDVKKIKNYNKAEIRYNEAGEETEIYNSKFTDESLPF
jgi:hypothetical protein